jgi:hypothetical protein
MRTPPLCQLWQLTEAGPGTYSLCDLADMHEALDMEDEYRRRWDALEKSKRKE